MLSKRYKLRAKSRKHDGFIEKILTTMTKEMAHNFLEREYERTLRLYCKSANIQGVSKLRKNGLIDAILDYADAQGWLSASPCAVVVSTQDKMTAIRAHDKYLGYVASLVKFGIELKAEVLTTCEEIRALPATCENYSIVPVMEYKPSEVQPLRIEPLDLASDDTASEIVKVCHNWQTLLSCETHEDIRHLVWGGRCDTDGHWAAIRQLCISAVLCGRNNLELSAYEKMLRAYLEARCSKPAPEVKDDTPEVKDDVDYVIDVEAYEVKKYPVEFWYEPVRKPFGRKEFRHTRQIMMFPREFMLDKSNLITNTKPEGKRG